MAATVERFGVDPATGRELSLVRVEAPEELTAELLPPRPFVCLLAWNVAGVAAARLTTVARTLIEAGCAYVCAHGSDCTRIDDAVDEECVDRQLAGQQVSFVMTSWHDDESPEAALWFLLENTIVADDVDDADYAPWNAPCRHAVVVDIAGAIADPEVVRAALAAPRAFSQRLAEQDPD